MPGCPAAHEHVGRPGLGVLERSSDHGGIPAEGHGEAELVTGHAIAGRQPGLLGPVRAAVHEDVSRPGAAVLAGYPNHGSCPTEDHREAGVVTPCRIGGAQPVLLRPGIDEHGVGRRPSGWQRQAGGGEGDALSRRARGGGP